MDKLCAVCCGTCAWCNYNPKTDELMCKNPDSEGYKSRTAGSEQSTLPEMRTVGTKEDKEEGDVR